MARKLKRHTNKHDIQTSNNQNKYRQSSQVPYIIGVFFGQRVSGARSIFKLTCSHFILFQQANLLNVWASFKV